MRKCIVLYLFMYARMHVLYAHICSVDTFLLDISHLHLHIHIVYQ